MEGITSKEIYFIMTLGIIACLFMALGIIYIYFNSERRYFQLQLMNQKDILKTMFETQEKERNRLAKDLHDSISSKLNVALLYLQQLDRDKNTEEKYLSTRQAINETLNASLAATRGLAHDLLPPTLEEFGLIEALKEISLSYSMLDNLDISLEVAPEKRIRFIVHGKAEDVFIKIDGPPRLLAISYEDNGRGFEMKDTKKGLGLKSIKSRIEILEGIWKYYSIPGKGFKAQIEINLPKKEMT